MPHLVPSLLILLVLPLAISLFPSTSSTQEFFPKNYVNQHGNHLGALQKGPPQDGRRDPKSATPKTYKGNAAPASLPASGPRVATKGDSFDPAVVSASNEERDSGASVSRTVKGAVYVNSLDKQHLDYVVAKVLALNKIGKIRISSLLHIGNPANLNPTQLKALESEGVVSMPLSFMIDSLNLERSPAWQLLDSSTKASAPLTVVQGFMNPEIFFDLSGRFNVPEGMVVNETSLKYGQENNKDDTQSDPTVTPPSAVTPPGAVDEGADTQTKGEESTDSKNTMSELKMRTILGKDGVPFPKPEEVLTPAPETPADEALSVPASTPVPWQPPGRCELSESKTVEGVYPEEQEESFILDRLFLPEDMVPMDSDEVYGPRVILYAYSTKPTLGQLSLQEMYSVPCLPYRIRTTTRQTFEHFGNDALKIYPRESTLKGDFHPWVKGKLFGSAAGK